MKILNIFPHIEDSDKMPQISLMADSSLLKDGKPFFIPDFDSAFTARPAMVVQICRLGKNIAPKFAHRYYNAIGVAVCVTAQTLYDTLKANNECTDLATSFDGSVILSDLKLLDEPHTISPDTHFTVNVDDATVWDFTSSKSSVIIDELIAGISRYYTMKIGDYLLLGIPGENPLQLQRDMLISATIDGEIAMSMHIK